MGGVGYGGSDDCDGDDGGGNELVGVWLPVPLQATRSRQKANDATAISRLAANVMIV